jgi:hypothetical protein
VTYITKHVSQLFHQSREAADHHRPDYTRQLNPRAKINPDAASALDGDITTFKINQGQSYDIKGSAAYESVCIRDLQSMLELCRAG